jgi:hypothetical protein
MCEGGEDMAAVVACDVCGNEIGVDVARCPFCRSPRTAIHKAKIKLPFKTVNLENGMPTVEQALERLQYEISFAAREGCKVLILIHGWGSSGQGGAIKQEVRRRLAFMLDNRQINDLLPGEECDTRFGHGRHLVRRFPFLKRYMGKTNPGISIVIV